MKRNTIVAVSIGAILVVGLLSAALYIGLLGSGDDDDSVVSFFVMGDSQGYQGSLVQIVEEANIEMPDFVFHCGDLTPFGQESQYQAVADVVDDLQVPFYTAAGNHDIKLDGATRYEAFFGAMNYSFDMNGVHFVVLDTSAGDINEGQISWLENSLNSTQAQWKFVFTHIPPFDPRDDDDHTLTNATTASRLMDIFELYDVDTVFTGHIHMYNESVRNGVRYVISGGAGASLAATLAEGGVYHYVNVTVYEDEVLIQPILLGSPSFGQQSVVIKSGDQDMTLSLQDLLSLPSVRGLSSFENQLGNWRGLGNYTGVKVSDLLELVGGMFLGQNLRVVSSDGFEQYFCYGNVYPNTTWYDFQGHMLLAYSYNGTLVPTWDDGMRLVMMPEDGAYSADDCSATSAPGQGYNVYPSAGARWVSYVSLIEVIDS